MSFREKSFAFIVGAPRCGTTSVARYLRDHPDVCFSKIKEPHFFAQHDLRHLSREELSAFIDREYLQRFFGPGSETARLRAEGSVSYLYAAEQLEPILSIWPQSKFIVCIRDPMEMIPSLHRRLLYVGHETVDDFGRAWALVESRRKGQHTPRRCVDPRLLDYVEAGRLGTHLQRLFKVVGKHRCFVSVYDDLERDPAQQYRRLLDFLDLPDDGRTEFKTHRSSKAYKVGWLQRLLKHPPEAMRPLFASARDQAQSSIFEQRRHPNALAELVQDTRKRLLRWNRLEAPPASLSAELRRSIRDILRPEIELLSTLIDRDLDHWLDDADVRHARPLTGLQPRIDRQLRTGS